MPVKLSKLNQSVEKTLQIIEILAKERAAMRLQDIAAACGMPASTALRMLNTLLVYGYINQDPNTLQYSLSLKFAQIGSIACETVSLRDVAHPFMVQLSRSSGESSCLAVEENMEVVYTDVQEGPDSMLKIMQRIGKRAPMHATGIGKLLLLNYSDEAIDRFISEKGLPVLTPNTLANKQALLKELERIRGQGYALDNEECELGARCVAAPIRDYTGRIVAGISVSGPLTRLSMNDIQKITPLVMEAAENISRLLAYSNEGIGKQ